MKAQSEKGSDSPAPGDALSLEAIGRSVVVKPADTKMIADESTLLLERIDGFHKPRIERAGLRRSVIGKPAMLPAGDSGTWLNGRPLEADELDGKVVLLDFWALSCGPCIEELPKTNRWHNKYSPKGLAVIAVIDVSSIMANCSKRIMLKGFHTMHLSTGPARFEWCGPATTSIR